MAGAGRCACGAITYRVSGALRHVIDCHCDRCRHWTGHHMAATAAAVEDLSIEGEAILRWWTPDEEPTVAYGSCSTCGSSLFWRSTAWPSRVSICAGTLEQPTGLRTEHALFTAEAGDYHEPTPTPGSDPYDRGSDAT